MNIEVKKTQIHSKRQFSTLLDKILDKYKPSDECMNTLPDNPLFKTTCDYVGLINDIFTLSKTLSKMADYQEMLLDN